MLLKDLNPGDYFKFIYGTIPSKSIARKLQGNKVYFLADFSHGNYNDNEEVMKCDENGKALGLTINDIKSGQYFSLLDSDVYVWVKPFYNTSNNAIIVKSYYDGKSVPRLDKISSTASFRIVQKPSNIPF